MHYIRDAYEPINIPVVFDPEKYKTAEEACNVFYKCLQACTPVLGQQESEVYLITPEYSKRNGLPAWWGVGWEAGPMDWAVFASIEFMFNREAGWHTETQFGFDLFFVDDSKT